MTVFACALALERHPPAAEAIRAAGFDVCSHGWRWIKHDDLTEAEEREHIRRAVASLEADRRRAAARLVLPLWAEREHAPARRRGGRLSLRLRLLQRRVALLADGDGRPHLIVPYSLTNNDGKYAGWMGTADEWFAFIRDAFDMLYKEGATQPKMMSVGLHMRLIGHPARGLPAWSVCSITSPGMTACGSRAALTSRGTGRPRTPTPAKASTSSRGRQAGRLAQSSNDIGCRTISSASF